ncbi:jg7293 [Pararge aegeria aegeria]|uniref:Jg7293 protein n=1 Tax=Pararge aegeria aegeria TaxID=348720 RepID=A0A8S4QVD4_9NEOP|nr:jg7293 [Pararge aegeria aegeria]
MVLEHRSTALLECWLMDCNYCAHRILINFTSSLDNSHATDWQKLLSMEEEKYEERREKNKLKPLKERTKTRKGSLIALSDISVQSEEYCEYSPDTQVTRHARRSRLVAGGDIKYS